MRKIAAAAAVLALAAGVLLVERLTRKPPPAQAPAAKPEDGTLVLQEPDYVLLEGTGATLTPPFRVLEDPEASEGKAIEIPANHGDAPVHEHIKGAEKAAAAIPFSVPEAGDYFVWFRFWACCACGDSFRFRIDSQDPADVASSNFRVWHWVTWRFQDPERMGQPRPVRLAAGAHRLLISHREDGIRIDQVLLTSDPEFTPARVMKPRAAAPAPAPAPPPAAGRPAQ